MFQIDFVIKNFVFKTKNSPLYVCISVEARVGFDLVENISASGPNIFISPSDRICFEIKSV